VSVSQNVPQTAGPSLKVTPIATDLED